MSGGYLFELGKVNTSRMLSRVIVNTIKKKKNGMCTDQLELTLDHGAKIEPCWAKC